MTYVHYLSTQLSVFDVDPKIARRGLALPSRSPATLEGAPSASTDRSGNCFLFEQVADDGKSRRGTPPRAFNRRVAQTQGRDQAQNRTETAPD